MIACSALRKDDRTLAVYQTCEVSPGSLINWQSDIFLMQPSNCLDTHSFEPFTDSLVTATNTLRYICQRETLVRIQSFNC